MKDLNIEFPLDKFENLITQMGWKNLDEWFYFWDSKKEIISINKFWDESVNEDWIWGLALPLLSDIQKSKSSLRGRNVFGISALPGCGKTCLGKWLEASAKILGISLKVLSLDDFYLPGIELDKALKNNPWNVPRGLPGSHSIRLLENTIEIF